MTTWTLNSDVYRWLHAVRRAAGTDDARPVLSGVLIESDGDTVTLRATDSYRAYTVTGPAYDLPKGTSALVPASVLRHVPNTMRGHQHVTITLDAKRVTIGVDGNTFGAPLIANDPPWPAESLDRIDADTLALDEGEAAKGFNPGYLGCIFTTARIFNDGAPVVVRHTLDPMKPNRFVVKGYDRDELTMLLIPVRVLP